MNESLKIVLELTDKLTGPARRALGVTGKLEDQLAATRRELRDLNKISKDATGLETLQQRIRKGNADLTIAQANYDKLASRIKATEDPSATLLAQLEKKEIRLKSLRDKQDKYNRELKDTEKRLTSAGVDTKQLASEQKRLATAIDGTTGKVNEQSSAMAKLNQQQRRMIQLKAQHDKTMQRISHMTVSGAGAFYAGKTIARAAATPTTIAMDFEEQISKVEALTRLDKTKTDDAATLKALRQQALDLGSSTSFTAAEAASAQSYLAMAGFDPDKIQKSMPGMLNLAKAAGQDLASTADIGSNILSGFRLQADDMNRVGDVLVATFTRSNVNLRQLGESMKYAAPIAAELGISLEETAAMAGLLGNVGIQGSEAGTALRGIFNRLAAPPKEAEQSLIALGIKVKDEDTGNLRAIPDILAEVAAKTEKMGSAERMEHFKKIAGMEAGSAFAELVNQQGAEGIIKLKEVLNKALGESQRVANIMGDNTRGQLKKAQSAWQGLMIEIGSRLSPILDKMLERATQLINKTTEWINKNPELAETLVKVGIGLGITVAAMSALSLGLAALLGPLAIARFALGSVGLAGKGAGGILLRTLLSPLKLVGFGFKWLWRIMRLSPVGLLVSAIVYGAYQIYKNWDKLVKWWNTTTLDEKITDVKTWAMDAAWDLARRFVNWWTGTKLDPLKASIDITGGAIPKVTQAIETYQTASGTAKVGKALVEKAGGWDGIKSKAQELVQKVQIMKQQAAVMQDGGARASGGPVLPGHFYRVNELGPELLTMGGNTYLMAHAAGHVTPLIREARNDDALSNDRFQDPKITDLLAIKQPSNDRQINIESPLTVQLTIHATPGMSEQALADAVTRKLKQLERDRQRQIRAQLNDGIN